MNRPIPWLSARNSLCIALLSILIAFDLPAASAQKIHPPLSRASIQTALRAGKPFLLVVSPASVPSDDDEAYADWASSLNDFATGAGSKTRIIKLSALRYKQLCAQPSIEQRFAILFVRDRQHVLFYDGTVLEPAVYSLGLAYLNRRPLDEKAADSYGLKPGPLTLK